MTFGGFEGGYRTGFRFQLAGITRTANTDVVPRRPVDER